MNNIQINHFKAFKDDLIINLSNKNFLLYGENGSGKSSIYEALRIVFFKSRIERNIQDVPTQEEQNQITRDFWGKYNNKVDNQGFTIKINNIDYDIFPNEDYQTFMISLEEIVFGDTINLNSLLQKFYFAIPDIDTFCLNQFVDIQTSVNKALEDFNESIRIEIDKEDGYNIKLIDDEKNIESKIEIRKYFNEAKLNLVTLLVLFTSINSAQDVSKKRILILDDFITSLDASNRTFLIKYVFQKFKNFQKLIFTHNVSFYNLIMYLINDIYKENTDWEFANLYEIKNQSKLFLKSSILRAADIESMYHSIPASNNSILIEEIGNKIRQKFEILLYEFSKLIMIGAVEDSKKIIERIDKSKNIYYHDNKTASDLVDEINAILNNQSDKKRLRNRVNIKIKEYKYSEFKNFKYIISELKLYQKVTMHPMSHGSIGQSSFTTNEIEESIRLLVKFEKQLKELVGSNVDRI